ncbi:hypothetical protein SLA2020_135140 [Shorea laevis]
MRSRSRNRNGADVAPTSTCRWILSSSHSKIYSFNVTAGETKLMRQQSVDSNSRRKIPVITEERKPRKREANKAHMEIGKEN